MKNLFSHTGVLFFMGITINDMEINKETSPAETVHSSDSKEVLSDMTAKVNGGGIYSLVRNTERESRVRV